MIDILIAAAMLPQLFAPGTISSPITTTAPSFTPDGQTVVFQETQNGERRLMTSRLVGDQWSPPAAITFSGRWFYVEPAISRDGQYMIVASNRALDGSDKPLDGAWGGKPQPGRGGALWRSERTASGWSEPVRLPDVINSGTSTFEPALTASGTLYFMRSGPEGGFHLLRAERTATGYAMPKPLPFDGAQQNDFDPAVSADDRFLIFASARRGGLKEPQLWISFHSQGGWTPPQQLPPAVNRGFGLLEPHLSPDDRTLYYTQGAQIWSAPIGEIVRQMMPASMR